MEQRYKIVENTDFEANSKEFNDSTVINFKGSIKTTIKKLLSSYDDDLKSNKKYLILTDNSNNIDELKKCVNALNIQDLRKRYEYIYDTVCDELDEKFVSCNYCQFKDDRCTANRNTKAFDKMGCCYSYELKSFIGIPIFCNEHLCEHQVNRSCNVKNLPCKLFTCKYLKKKGIVFNPHKIPLLDSFFSTKQMDIISFNFFITREEIIDKLMKKDYSPYIWWLFTRGYLVKRNK